MKRIAILVALALLSLEVSARSIHYFTYSQAARTVSYLNAQNEMMIYFGYEYELPTYVLINEVWMERVNSSYYELWVYGYDAYTGDEIYMPLDLEGVWLYSAGHMYNAAQYLRFRVDVRRHSLTWYIPPYSPYTRVVHRHGYSRTYHYDIHRHGWMPPAYTYGPGMPPPPLPYYYMRHPSTSAPMPTGTWTPGSSKPTINTAEMTRDHNPSTGTQVRSSHTSSSSSSTNRSVGGSRGGTSTGTPASRSTTETRGTTTRGTSETRSTSETRGTTETCGTSTNTTRSTTPTRSTVEPAPPNAAPQPPRRPAPLNAALPPPPLLRRPAAPQQRPAALSATPQPLRQPVVPRHLPAALLAPALRVPAAPDKNKKR